MVSSLCAIRGGDVARRESVWREQSPHRRIVLQGPRPRAAPGSRARSAPPRCGALDKGRPRRIALMTTVVIDYGSGNLRSAAKAFERAARESGADGRVLVTNHAESLRGAARIVL